MKQDKAGEVIDAVSRLLDNHLHTTVTSKMYRTSEDPPSAAWHMVIGGKRFVLLLQPLDMMDARLHEPKEQADVR